MSTKVHPTSCLSLRNGIMTYFITLSCLLQSILTPQLHAQTSEQTTNKQTTAQEAPNKAEASQKKNQLEKEKLEIARREYKLGLVDFKQKRYREALKRFIRVYRLQPHPNLIYNMARSFEELKEYQNAAEYYQKYLKIEPDSPDRAQIEITIETMEKLAQKPSPNQQHQEQFLTKRMAWSGVAMGSIMIVGGAMFGVRALNRTDTLNSYQAGDSIQDFNRTYQERDQAALLSDLFMLSGVALGSLGLYFALKSPPSQASSSSTSIPGQMPNKSDNSSQTPPNQTSLSLSFGLNGFSIQGAF